MAAAGFLIYAFAVLIHLGGDGSAWYDTRSKNGWRGKTYVGLFMLIGVILILLSAATILWRMFP